MKINVNGVDGHLPFREINVRKIPRVGEVLELDDETWTVVNVIHDVENESIRLEVE